MTMGIVSVACLAGARGTISTRRDDEIHIEPYQLSRERGDAIAFSLCISILNDNVFSLYVSKLP